MRLSVVFFSISFLWPVAHAKAGDLSSLILEFGQPRSLLWSILEERPAGAAPLAFYLADQLALNPDRTRWPYSSETRLSFTPLLEYDRNVNNGFKGDTIYLAGLPFKVNDDAQAVEAATVGGAISGGLSFGIAKGLTFTMSGRSAYSHAIGYDFEVTNNTFAINSGYTSQNWTYLDTGFLINEESRELSKDRVRMTTVTVGKIFGKAYNHLHDISWTFSHVEDEAVWQKRLRVDWSGAFSDVGYFKLGLERGEKIDGYLLPELTASVSYSNIIFGAATSMSAYHSKKTGGYFFGSSRTDEVYKFKIDRKLSDHVNAFISYEKTASSIDSFDDAGFDVGIRITGFNL